jgi:hypothetical protein
MQQQDWGFSELYDGALHLISQRNMPAYLDFFTTRGRFIQCVYGRYAGPDGQGNGVSSRGA